MSMSVSAKIAPLLYGLVTRTQDQPDCQLQPMGVGASKLALVTKRLKLFETKGRLNASLWVLSSLTRPSPTLFTEAGSFGKLGGKSDDNSKSETLVDKAEVGTLNFRLLEAGCWVFEAAGGNDGRAVTAGRTG